jgi:sec-independent protein translocase protein TatB
MFDIGFSELMVIAVVALIVIGPERLPKVARTMGHLFGRLQRYVNDVKADINREIELDELRKFKSTFEDAAREVEHSVHAEAAKAQSELDSIAQTADPAATGGLTNPSAPTPAQELKDLKTEVEQAGRSIEDSAGSVERSVREEAARTESALGSPAQPDREKGPAGPAHSPDAPRQKTAV